MSLAPLIDQSTTTSASATTTATANAIPSSTPSSEAASKLAEAIDDFLGDVERKFKSISDEILTKLDDMAERCDRLEQEMLMRDSSTASIDTRSKSTLKSEGVGDPTI